MVRPPVRNILSRFSAAFLRRGGSHAITHLHQSHQPPRGNAEIAAAKEVSQTQACHRSRVSAREIQRHRGRQGTHTHTQHGIPALFLVLRKLGELGCSVRSRIATVGRLLPFIVGAHQLGIWWGPSRGLHRMTFLTDPRRGLCANTASACVWSGGRSAKKSHCLSALVLSYTPA